MLPALGARMPATMRPSVDLPQPDSPTRPTTSPSCDREIDAVDRAHDRFPHAGAEQVGDARREIERLDEAFG